MEMSLLEEIMKSGVEEKDLNSLFESRVHGKIINLSKSTESAMINLLESNMNNYMNILIKDLMKEYQNMCVNFTNISKSVVTKEIKRYESDVTKIHEESQHLKNKVILLDQQINNHKVFIKNIFHKMNHYKDINIQNRYMFIWRIRREEICRQKFCEKIAVNFYQFNLKKAMFYNWKSFVETSWKVRYNWKMEKQSQAICKQLVDEYEKQILELKSDLSKVQEENEVMMSSRSTIQDSIKKALMRGVCALNMETINVLSENGVLNESKEYFQEKIEVYQKNGISNGDNDSRGYHEELHIDNCHSMSSYDDKPRVPLIKSSNDYSKEIQNCTQTRGYSHKISAFSHRKEPSIRSILNPTDNDKGYHSSRKSAHKSHPITVLAGNPSGSHTCGSSKIPDITIHRH